MNDDFQAPNVPRGRLTLQTNQRLGIFGRAKASSPMRFNETMDMARFKPKLEQTLCGDSVSRLERQPKSNLNNLGRKDLPHHLYFGSPTWPGSKSRRLGFPIVEAFEETTKSGQPTTPEMVGQLLSCHSATPFTWSETASKAPDDEKEIEGYLMEILHAGVLPVTTGERPVFTSANKKYCNLDDLKLLLQSRMALWNESHDAGSIISISTALDIPSEHEMPSNTSSYHDRAVTGVMRPSNINPNDSIKGMRPELSCSSPSRNFTSDPTGLTNTKLNTHDGPTQSSQSVEHNQSIRIGEVDVGADTDVTFFRSLDAAFWAIMGPQGDNEISHMKSPCLMPQPDVRNPKEESLLKTVNSSFFGSIDTLSHPAVEIETAQRPIDSKVPLAAHHEPAEFIAPNGEERLDLSSSSVFLVTKKQSDFTAPTAPPTTHLYPPGFWRRNILY
ncbi:hypothetical protein N7470_005338 [Penicillium chermesinum]|nr:hypothetical protein N7470_005338 [Penicillium chermesinum]